MPENCIWIWRSACRRNGVLHSLACSGGAPVPRCASAATCPGTVRNADYQMDVWPDGTLGEVFAVDGSAGRLCEQKMKSSFDSDDFARMMTLLESWGAADSRWRLAAGMALTRGFPVEDENGNPSLFAMLVQPNWVKARWRAAVLQNAKCYCRAWAGVQREDAR